MCSCWCRPANALREHRCGGAPRPQRSPWLLEPTPPECSNLSDYCGGSWAGVEAHLDYIQGLGFDAVWVSPVVDNAPGGYHGYWQRNMSAVNAHFGQASDLASLSAALHARGMFLMVDVVANHASSSSDVSMNVPFSSPQAATLMTTLT